MGGCGIIKNYRIKKETIVWFVLLTIVAIDFLLTFYGITTRKAIELNPYTKGLWADPYANFTPLFLYTFISMPFMYYGLWSFFGKNNKYLYFNIAYFTIIVINNITVTLL